MARVINAEEWADAMLGGCDLGDARRTARLVKLAAGLAGQAGASVSRSCEGDEAAKEGAYRWLRNGNIGHERVAEGGFAATAGAAEEVALLLAVEDSTTPSVKHGVANALGDTGGKANSKARGVWAHSVLLLDARSEQTVGLIEQRLWQRDGQRGARHTRKERAVEEKESYKWQQASERMARRLGPTLGRVISVGDRESDVHAYLRCKQQQGQRLIVRAAQDRRVEEGTLFAQMAAAALLGRMDVPVAQRGGRAARKATVEVRAARVRLQAPRGAKDEAVEIPAVWAHEKKERADALDWLLPTSEPVEEMAQARQIPRWYGLPLAHRRLPQGVEGRRRGRSATAASARQHPAAVHAPGVHRRAIAAIAGSGDRARRR